MRSVATVDTVGGPGLPGYGRLFAVVESDSCGTPLAGFRFLLFDETSLGLSSQVVRQAMLLIREIHEAGYLSPDHA
jgi:hypothetical protein